jgi:hypothetical protein
MINSLEKVSDTELALSIQLADAQLALLKSERARIDLLGPQAEAKLRVLYAEQERREQVVEPKPELLDTHVPAVEKKPE